jgi:hypothetical protein
MKSVRTTLILLSSFISLAAATRNYVDPRDASLVARQQNSPCYPFIMNATMGVNSTLYGNMNISDAVGMAASLLGSNGPNTNAPATNTSTLIQGTLTANGVTCNLQNTLHIGLAVTGLWSTSTQSQLLLNAILGMSIANMDITMTPWCTDSGEGYMPQFRGPSYFSAALWDSCDDVIAWLALSLDNQVPSSLDACNSNVAGIVTDAIWDILQPGGFAVGGIMAAIVAFACALVDNEL